MKTRLPNISLEYYSDGRGGQCKNRKNFRNLCLHKQDYNLTAKWYFFATSHRKQPCDGIGGTVKRLAAKHSLQNDVSNHILNPQQIFHFCQQSIKEIDFFFISTSDVPMLDDQFKNVETLPGTRSFHEFIPISERHIAAKRCCDDEAFNIKHDLLKLPAEPQIEVLSYVTCLYDNEWWVGIILEINEDERDILVK